jgi:hypothetical protein
MWVVGLFFTLLLKCSFVYGSIHEENLKSGSKDWFTPIIPDYSPVEGFATPFSTSIGKQIPLSSHVVEKFKMCLYLSIDLDTMEEVELD